MATKTKTGHFVLRTLILTVLALTAFAANSVLCRLALGTGSIDAPGFTIVRLLSAAAVLWLILKGVNRRTDPSSMGSWTASSMLFVYAITFSLAYISLDTGTGALILFGSVQMTMIMSSLVTGSRLRLTEWLGVVLAFAGLVYLVLPGVSSPSLEGFILMTVAGLAWGIYTLKGRGSINPLADTSYNFLRTIPFVMVLLIATLDNMQFSFTGVVLAVLSGAIASGVGYTIWYMALAGLSTTVAAVVQLSVPAIAALGGVVFVGESITLRLTLSTLVILGGILLVVARR